MVSPPFNVYFFAKLRLIDLASLAKPSLAKVQRLTLSSVGKSMRKHILYTGIRIGSAFLADNWPYLSAFYYKCPVTEIQYIEI